jgi:hypothetical protein
MLQEAALQTRLTARSRFGIEARTTYLLKLPVCMWAAVQCPTCPHSFRPPNIGKARSKGTRNEDEHNHAGHDPVFRVLKEPRWMVLSHIGSDHRLHSLLQPAQLGSHSARGALWPFVVSFRMYCAVMYLYYRVRPLLHVTITRMRTAAPTAVLSDGCMEILQPNPAPESLWWASCVG